MSEEFKPIPNRQASFREKAIKDALVEYVTGTIGESQCRRILLANGCDEGQADGLISSAPKTISPRTKKKFRGEELPTPPILSATGRK